MATIGALNLSRFVVNTSSQTPKAQLQPQTSNYPWKRCSKIGAGAGRMMYVKPLSAAPDSIYEKVAESIKGAEEACAGDPVSGECAAAWDEVEELSAAASHARDKLKDSDPLEAYCKDNMETDECRTYED